MNMQELIAKKCDEVKEMLLKKNKSYGNSVASPINIFSKMTPIQQVQVRIDDKLKRIIEGKNFENEDTITDLIGYLILYKILLENVVENHKSKPNVVYTKEEIGINRF